VGHTTIRRSLYFGTYRNKCVEQITQIETVVDLESEDEATVVWRNENLGLDFLISAPSASLRLKNIENHLGSL
jgi:hypothetical protein